MACRLNRDKLSFQTVRGVHIAKKQPGHIIQPLSDREQIKNQSGTARKISSENQMHSSELNAQRPSLFFFRQELRGAATNTAISHT